MLYRGAQPMLNGKKVEIVYETCDADGTPKYKIEDDPRWYRGYFIIHGYDREIELSLIK